MWPSLLPMLCCPACRGPLSAFRFDTHRRVAADETKPIESGLLTCRPCRQWFPIVRSVPVLLPYATARHHAFAREHEVRIATLAIGYSCVASRPKRARFAIDWRRGRPEAGGADRDASVESRLVAELGDAIARRLPGGWFLDAACNDGGHVVRIAGALYQAPAVGMAEGETIFRAAATHASDPTVHFVQCVADAPPFRSGAFATVYARGVLHAGGRRSHDAWSSLGELCSQGATVFVPLPRASSFGFARMRGAAGRGRGTLATLIDGTARRLAAGMRASGIAKASHSAGRAEEEIRAGAASVLPAASAPSIGADRAVGGRLQDAAHVSRVLRSAGCSEIEIVEAPCGGPAEARNERVTLGVRARRTQSGERGTAGAGVSPLATGGSLDLGQERA